MRKSTIFSVLAAATTLTLGLTACDPDIATDTAAVSAQEQAVADAEAKASAAEERAAEAEKAAQEAEEAAEKAQQEAEAQASQEAEEKAAEEQADVSVYEMSAEDEAVIVDMSLNMAWDDTSASDQTDLCLGYAMDEEWALDMMSEDYDVDVLSISEVKDIMRDFFNEKCF